MSVVCFAGCVHLSLHAPMCLCVWVHYKIYGRSSYKMNCELMHWKRNNKLFHSARIKEGKIIMAKLRASAPCSTFFFYHITRNCFSAAPLSLSNSTERERETEGGRKFGSRMNCSSSLDAELCVCALAYHLFNSVIAVFLIIMAALELRAHLQVGKVPV
jgi:hypothetical protein